MRAVLPVVLFTLLAGCGEDSPTTVAGNPPIPVDHTDPAALIAAWGAALEARDLDAYTALLEEEPAGRAEPGFRYYPDIEDEDEFPWLQGGYSWDRAEELAMIGHMFDPAYVSEATGGNVDRITVDSAIIEQQDLGGGEIEVTTHFVVTVLWTAETGALADVQLIHVLAPDSDGFLRIREQRELPAGGLRIETRGWGRLKAFYR